MAIWDFCKKFLLLESRKHVQPLKIMAKLTEELKKFIIRSKSCETFHLHLAKLINSLVMPLLRFFFRNWAALKTDILRPSQPADISFNSLWVERGNEKSLLCQLFLLLLKTFMKMVCVWSVFWRRLLVFMAFCPLAVKFEELLSIFGYFGSDGFRTIFVDFSLFLFALLIFMDFCGLLLPYC